MGNSLDSSDEEGNKHQQHSKEASTSSPNRDQRRRTSKTPGGTPRSTSSSSPMIAGAGTALASASASSNNIAPAASSARLLTQSQRDIVRQIWDSAKRTEFCPRIFKRVFEKRPDFRAPFNSIGPDAWLDESRLFAQFMTQVVERLSTNDFQEIERLSLNLGRRYGQLRSSGFKSEFWVAFAESMTMECVYLDAGAHPTPDVLSAWSTLLSLVFGWVRDGYYDKLRVQRRLDKISWRSSATNSFNSSSGRSLSESNSRASSFDEPQHQHHHLHPPSKSPR